MKDFTDERINLLYYLVLDPSEPMINEDQKIAVVQLSEWASAGDENANRALIALERQPYLHPFLKEMVQMALKAHAATKRNGMNCTAS